MIPSLPLTLPLTLPLLADLDSVGAVAILAGLSTGLILGAVGAWWLWGRAAPVRLSPAGLALRVPWPETLPPPRVGRQIWVAPDAGSRRALVEALARRLAWAGPVLLVSDSPLSAAGVYRPALDEEAPEALLAAARAMVGEGILLLEGPRPILAALMASDVPALAVLAEGDPLPPGVAVSARLDGPADLEAF